MNKLRNGALVVSMAIVTVLVTGDIAWAAALTPAEEATGLFNSSKGQVLDVAKQMAPLVIGFGLVLFVIRKVTGGLSRAKAPRL